MTPQTYSRDLEGRVAVVTGGSRGIGAGVALELGARGARVVVNYRRKEDAALATVEAIRDAGSEAVAVGASMAEIEEVDRLAEEALAAFGHVDIIIANAGVASQGQTVANTAAEEVDRLMRIHALSAHRLTSLLLPQMRTRKRGDVIVISSSEVGEHRPLGAPYEMAKAALESFALTLAREEARNGIRVNIVAPGLVYTDMGSRLVKATLGVEDVAELDRAQPFGRACQPADIGRLVALLVGPGADLITGERIGIDGGAPDAAFASNES